LRKPFLYQIGLIALGILSVFGLYFFGKTSQPITLDEAVDVFGATNQKVEFNISSFLQNAELQLTQEEEKRLKSTKSTEKVPFWQSIDRNDVAALLLKEKAEEKRDGATWVLAGDSFIRAFRETPDSLEQAFFLQESVSSYEKSLDFQQTTATKLKLAKIHTGLTGAVMKGVQLYREIIEEDPEHIQANYELGLLSVQSGQIDKALERFDLLIKAEPKFIEPYIYKAQILLDSDRDTEAKDVLNLAIANSTNQEGIAVLQEMMKSIK